MDGRELLIEEMKKRGCTKNQLTSRVVDVMLEIFAQDNPPNVVKCLEENAEWHQREYSNYVLARRKCEREQERLEYERRECSAEYRKLKSKEKEIEDIKELQAAHIKELETFETGDAADRYRLACLYEAKCNSETIPGWNGYTATAFVKEYGRILSGASNDGE